MINDIDDSVERLLSISHLPLSVIFVGIGPADFSQMVGSKNKTNRLRLVLPFLLKNDTKTKRS